MSEHGRDSEHCREMARFIQRLELGQAEPQDEAWREHRSACASCRSGWRVEQQLSRLFAEVPRPALSADFGAALNARLDAEGASSPGLRHERFLLPVYWACAAGASLAILGRIDGVASAPLWGWIVTGAAVWLALVPLAVMSRRLGLDVLDLVFLPAAGPERTL